MTFYLTAFAPWDSFPVTVYLACYAFCLPLDNVSLTVYLASYALFFAY